MRATYHTCDVSDQTSLAAVLDSIRTTDGPIEGILHGAGIEAACKLVRKKPASVAATIASKCDGAANLIFNLELQDSLGQVVDDVTFYSTMNDGDGDGLRGAIEGPDPLEILH